MAGEDDQAGVGRPDPKGEISLSDDGLVPAVALRTTNFITLQEIVEVGSFLDTSGMIIAACLNPEESDLDATKLAEFRDSFDKSRTNIIGQLWNIKGKCRLLPPGGYWPTFCPEFSFFMEWHLLEAIRLITEETNTSDNERLELAKQLRAVGHIIRLAGVHPNDLRHVPQLAEYERYKEKQPRIELDKRIAEREHREFECTELKPYSYRSTAQPSLLVTRDGLAALLVQFGELLARKTHEADRGGAQPKASDVSQGGDEAEPIEDSGSEENGKETPHARSEELSSDAKARPVKRPSDNALKAWRLRDLKGINDQTELAAKLIEQGVSATQGQVSRWLKQVEEYLKAGNVLPTIDPLTSQPDSMDPNTLDMGKRQDGRTPRQRDRRDPDSDDR